jgi:hypothetical protein
LATTTTTATTATTATAATTLQSPSSLPQASKQSVQLSQPQQPSDSTKLSSVVWNVPFISAQPVVSILKIQEEVSYIYQFIETNYLSNSLTNVFLFL